MATIDKSLPNTKTEIEIPGEEVIVEQQEKLVETEEGKETDITIEEDGSATVNFDPKAVTPEGGEDHFENLAEFLDDNVLDPLASALTAYDQYNKYKNEEGLIYICSMIRRRLFNWQSQKQLIQPDKVLNQQKIEDRIAYGYNR